MGRDTLLVELILAGFFAVACLRAGMPRIGSQLRFGDLFRFPGRLERLRRSRWQWFSMVALLLVVRLQRGGPLVLEVIVAVMFLLFFALPASAMVTAGVHSR
jgi:hypothetical protein